MMYLCIVFLVSETFFWFRPFSKGSGFFYLGMSKKKPNIVSGFFQCKGVFSISGFFQCKGVFSISGFFQCKGVFLGLKKNFDKGLAFTFFLLIIAP